tara:strand:- start:9492 stop:11567 length:2076 start_codon:yes stop_codon:yes gene_type:complete
MNLTTQLSSLPAGWGFVAVNGNKQPYQKDWQNNPLTRGELFSELKSDRAKAIGVLAGPQSGGILFLDHDGSSCDSLLASKDWGELPPSWMVTSGRVGRYQIIYQVPKDYWDKINTRKFKTGVKDKEGNIEQIELRWTGCQSVVCGEHPSTDGYSWMTGRSPDDIPLATAPDFILQKMLPKKKERTKPVKVEVIIDSDYEKALNYLDALAPLRADNYDDWLAVGMSLHSVGDDRLLAPWDQWSSQSHLYEPGKCEEKWNSFGKRSGVSLGTLHHLATADGWSPPPKTFPKSLTPPPKKQEQVSIISKKLEQLSANELLHFLRSQKQEIRFNIFTQSIEMDGQPIKGAERFYLQLAQLGYKVPKELALDCLVTISRENEYDPVRDYLEDCADNIAPTYIERLATTYLRPSDISQSEPTIYDHMLKITLINAVRRCFQPGCKHDTATVLMGPQGARKSSFWKTLGGQFFSDALGDISSKDDLLVLARSWIMEWSELDSVTSKKHAGQIKSFLSRSTDLFRVPYGKATEEHPRRGIVVGSTNRESGFLLDDTGNRRFHVIPVESTMSKPIDLESLEIERNSIWSAAVHAYRNKEPHYLTIDQENFIQEENESYLVDHPWLPRVAEYLAGHASFENITTELLLTQAVEKDLDRLTRADQMAMAVILKKLGYARKRKTTPQGYRWTWQLDSPTSLKR